MQCGVWEQNPTHHKDLRLEDWDSVVAEVELDEVEVLEHLVVVADHVDQVASQVDHLQVGHHYSNLFSPFSWIDHDMMNKIWNANIKTESSFQARLWIFSWLLILVSDSNLVRNRFYRRIAMSGLQKTKRSAGNSPEGFSGRKPCQTISRSCPWCSTPSALEVWRELLKSIAINAKPSATDYKVDRKHWQWDNMVEPLCDNHCQNYHWCPRAGLSPRGGSRGWPRAPAPPCRGSSAGFPQCSTPWWRHFDWINLYDIISRWCVNMIVLDLILVASEKILVGRDRREFPSRIRNSSLRKRMVMVMKLVQDAQAPV